MKGLGRDSYLSCLLGLLFLGCGYFSVQAQDATMIHSGANMHSFGEATIFGDLQTEGNIYQETNTSIVFAGYYWQNGSGAQIIGDGNVEFLQPNPLTGNSFLQTIDAGGTASSFPSIEVNNLEHIALSNTDMKVRKNLRFRRGCIILDGNDLILGNNTPGSLSGYNHNRFVVTNSSANESKGFFIRENVQGFASAFPVGISVDDYNPVRLTNSGGLNDFKVRVFPDVYDFAIVGSPKLEKTVQRTWQVIESVPDSSIVELVLQHDQSSEGSLFSTQDNYIARYIGLAPNQAGGSLSLPDFEYWDFVGVNRCSPNLGADITTGSPQADAFTTARSLLRNLTDYTYYTVHSCSNDQEFIIPNMFTPNGDGINDTWEISSIQFFETRSLKIINRWGDIVFKSKSYNNDWSGIYAGQNLPAGTYFYILDMGEDGGIKKGDVTIIRE